MVTIDCDVHNYWHSADVLLPYLAPEWKDYYVRGEKPGPKGSLPYANRPYLLTEGFRRMDIFAEDMEGWVQLTRDHLDLYNIDYGILTSDEPLEVSTLSNPYYAAGLVSAYNDWQADTWLKADARFKGSIVISPTDPHLAAKEIRRMADNPNMVQVLSSEGSQMPYGNPFYHPIYDACAEVGLPFAIHLGGHGGINNACIANGPLTYSWEAHALLAQGAMTHMSSMLAHGIFEKHPDFLFIIMECGVSWMAPLLWRLDAGYRALKKETPWLKMLPSEYFRRNMRVTTQPLEQPENRKHLWAMLAAINAEDTLMFASDFPHWDFDDIGKLNLPPDIKDNVHGLTALKTFKRLEDPRKKTALAAE